MSSQVRLATYDGDAVLQADQHVNVTTAITAHLQVSLKTISNLHSCYWLTKWASPWRPKSSMSPVRSEQAAKAQADHGKQPVRNRRRSKSRWGRERCTTFARWPVSEVRAPRPHPHVPLELHQARRGLTQGPGHPRGPGLIKPPHF